MNLLMDPEVDFVTLTGIAGTGKTLMALAAGLTQVLDDRRYTEIIMTRATVSVARTSASCPAPRKRRWAPGWARDDNLMCWPHRQRGTGEWGRAATNELIRSKIKIKSMNFMRGRTFLNKYVILDEAQNLTPKQMKTLITRAGLHQDHLHGQPGADRHALPHGGLLGPHLRRRQIQGLAAQRPHHPGARRALAAGGLRERDVL